MDLELAQSTTTVKLPILKQENGNSFITTAQTTTNADGTSTTLIPGPVTTEEKVQKKNDVKARSFRRFTNEVNTAYGFSTANTQVSLASTASTQNSTANLSDATVYAFLASQPNWSQLVLEELVQIHKDDLEPIDLKHMTGNMSYLSKYEEIDGGYVAFGGDPKGGKITDTECVVLSPDFKLLDECQVLLRVPRKNNMYSVDLKNVAPS
nr:hypothetical protein [Tanacetum cinerariifolium]